jgi:hypothetical protein
MPEDGIFHSHRLENLKTLQGQNFRIVFTYTDLPTSGGRSIGIVRLWTKGHGVFLFTYTVPVVRL